MRTIIITALVAGFIGFLAGNAFWYLASPLWIDREVSESFTQTAEAQTLSTGDFSGSDAFHPGSGTATIIKTGAETVLRFTQFDVTNGPDLFVWLVKGNEADGLDLGSKVELGVLKGNIGDQNYTIPADVDLTDYGSVLIWCKQFAVLFASAELTQS